jgi:hypothetical protein
MGINYKTLKFLEKNIKKKKLSMATIGRQELHFPTPQNTRFTDNFLIKKFNLKKLVSFDINKLEGASEIKDFDNPINYKEKFDIFFDGGSLQHIFNIPQALKNIIKMTKLNGTIIHTVTFDGFQGFGLYQLSPEIFFNLYNKNNGFKNTKIYLIENLNNKFWYKINKKTKNKFNNFFSYGQLSIYVSTIKTKELVQINIKQKQKLAYNHSHNSLMYNLKRHSAVLFCYLFLKKIFLSVFPSFFLNFDKKVVKEKI